MIAKIDIFYTFDFFIFSVLRVFKVKGLDAKLNTIFEQSTQSENTPVSNKVKFLTKCYFLQNL